MTAPIPRQDNLTTYRSRQVSLTFGVTMAVVVALLEIIFEPLAEIVLGLVAVGVAWFFGTIAYTVWGRGRAIADSPPPTPVIGRRLFGRSEGGHLTPDRQLDAYDTLAIIVTPLLCGLVILAFIALLVELVIAGLIGIWFMAFRTAKRRLAP